MRCNKHKMYHLPCIICQELEESNNNYLKVKTLMKELQKSNPPHRLTLERINPDVKLKLSVQDLNAIRGLCIANSFLYCCQTQFENCLEFKKDEPTLNEFSKLCIELEEIWDRIKTILSGLVTDISDSNWNRIIKETQKVVDLAVKVMNSKDLGNFTIGEDDSLDVENDLKPKVQLAISEALSSSGTNNLTAYSREQLYQKLLKIVEEK